MLANDQQFNPKMAIKSTACTLASVAWPSLLVILIAALTGVLTYEAGQFFGGIGWGKAVLVEIVALSLIAYRPASGLDWFGKIIVLCGAFGMVVYGAAYHAAMPHLEADSIRAEDKVKMAAMGSDIAATMQAIDALQGQPSNIAMRTQQLAELVKQRNEFMSGLKVDKAKAAANMLAVVTAISFRIILQLGNWLLMHRLVAYFNGRIPVAEYDPQEKEVAIKSLPEPETKPYASQVASGVKWDAATLKILSKIEQNGGQIKRLQLQQSRISDTAGLDPRLNQLLESGVILQEKNGKVSETIYRINNA